MTRSDNKEYIKELEQQVEQLEAEKDSLKDDLDECEQANTSLEVAYEILSQDYDDLLQEYNGLTEADDNHVISSVIEDIHSMIGSGITAGDFKRIADMLCAKYSIKTPIWGLDYGE